MVRKPEQLKDLSLLVDESTERSVRQALRSIFRDCRCLCRALVGHGVRYGQVFARGWTRTNHRWTRREP
jgi:hypothetical protein